MSLTLQYKVRTMLALLKRPSGFLPVAISAMLAMCRLSERRLAALEVLALQLAAALTVFALVYAFHG